MSVTADLLRSAVQGSKIEQGSKDYLKSQKNLMALIKSGGDRAKDLNSQDPAHVRLYHALSELKEGGRVSLNLVLDWKTSVVKKYEISKTYLCLARGACPLD